MSDTKTDPQERAGVSKAKRDRSPSFPFIALPAALKRLVEFEEKFKRHPTPAKHSGSAWGMKGWTSQAQQTLAALKSFGMIEYSGSGPSLEAAITEDGRTYLRAQQESIKQQTVKRFALKPKVFAKYFSVWGADRPPDEVCLDRLVLKDGFTDGAAKLFLSVYDATIAFAKLGDSDKITQVAEGEIDDESDTPPPTVIEVGDFVQREAGGALTLPKPARVRHIAEHQGMQWVFVDGSEAAFLMSEAVLDSKATAADAIPTPPPDMPLPKDVAIEIPAGWREERLLDESGDEIFVRYKGAPSKERYEFIRDYLDFKLKRMK